MILQFTRRAQRDLERLRKFVALKNPHGARLISRRLVQSIRHLVNQPAMGVEVEELPGVRELVSGDYIVRCTVTDDNLYILRIWHGKEDR